MSQVRLNFLNWRPDLEDENHDGLTVADNVIHSAEGFKSIGLFSAGSFSTTGGLGVSNATVRAAAARPVGNGGDYLVAWISGPASGAQLNIGINGVTATSDTTGYPTAVAMASANSFAISVFDVCEAYDKIFFTVRGEGQSTSPSAISEKAMTGYLSY